MNFFATVWRNYERNERDVLESFLLSDVQFATKLNGGFASASAVLLLQPQELYNLYSYLLNTHIEIRDKYGLLVFEGYVNELTSVGNELTINMLGYYAHANNVIDDRIYVTSPTTVYDVIEGASDLVPSWKAPIQNLFEADYNLMTTDPETAADIPLDFTDMKVSEVVERCLSYGYSTDWAVPAHLVIYDGRTPQLLRIMDRSVFANIKSQAWALRKHNIVSQFGQSKSMNTVRNKIYAYYSNEGAGPSKTTAVEDTISSNMYGVIEGIVQNGGNQEGLAMAETLRDYALEVYSYPFSSISVDVTGIVKHYSGAVKYAHSLRAGEYVIFPELNLLYSQNPYDVFGSSANQYQTLITSTNYNSTSNVTTISVGIANESLNILMSRLGLSGGLK